MRLVHLSDLHVTDGPRLEDHRDTLDRVVSRGLELRPDAWLLTGDLYGHTVPHRSTPRERSVLFPAVARMAAAAPVVVIYGNHDADPDLDALACLGSAWPVRVVKRAEAFAIPTPAGPLNVYGLPYPTKRWLLAGDVAPSGVQATQEAIQAALDALFTAWSARIRLGRRQRPDEPHVLAAHVQVRGSVTGSGVVLAGQEIEITADQLERLAVDYGALGHLHDRQEAAPRCWYAGSLWHTAHSTANQPERSANLVEIGGWIGSPALEVKPIPSGCRPFVTLDYRWADRGDGSVGWCTWQGQPHEVYGAEVRMRLTVPAQHVAGCPWEAEIERVRGFGAHRIQAERVIEPVLRVRAPEVAEARTLEDKIRAYWPTLATPPRADEEAAALECLAELDELDDDQVAANTAALLA